MARNVENDKKIEVENSEMSGDTCICSLTAAAKDIVHEVVEVTIELAHEAKEKISGHVTDKDIANAAQKVIDLKADLANEQHHLKKILLAVELAERNLNLKEYEDLKLKETQTKNHEHRLEREIIEAEKEYVRRQDEKLAQQHAQKRSHEGD